MHHTTPQSSKNVDCIQETTVENDLNSNRPLISILTVVKNSEDTIEQTILSVINQKYNNVEYNIIDGCSTDNTINIIKKYEDKISYWISEKDYGISDAFNKGISICNGDIIGIINADDWYEDGIFSKVADRITSDQKIDIVHGYMRKWSTSSESELIFSDDKLLEVDSTVNHPTVFARKRVYSKIGLFRLDFKTAMDYEWLLRAKLSGQRFSCIDECLTNMRASGVSNRQWLQATLEVLKAKKIHLQSSKIIYLSFCFQVARIFTRRTLEKFRLNGIVKYYHSRHSLVTKKG
jgi:glycosyltransferase involved in cell wall biosynthesis